MRRTIVHIFTLVLSLGFLASCSRQNGTASDEFITLNNIWKFSSDTLTDVKFISTKISDMDDVVLPYGGTSEVSWYFNQFQTPASAKGKTVYLFLREEGQELSVWLNSIKVNLFNYENDHYMANVAGLLNNPGEMNTLQIRVSSPDSTTTLSGVAMVQKLPLHFQKMSPMAVKTNSTGCLVNMEVIIRNDAESAMDYFLDIKIMNSVGKVVGSLRRGEKIAPMSFYEGTLPVLIDLPRANKDAISTDEYTIEAKLSRGENIYDTVRYTTTFE